MTTVNGALEQFAAVREGARRFHADDIGSDTDVRHCFADFLVRVHAGDRAGLEKVYGSLQVTDGRHPVTKAALAETSGTTGGYMVPSELRYDLMKDVAEEAIFRPRCLVVPMTSATLDLSLPDAVTAPSAGTTPFLGGILLSFKPEAATRSETEPAWRKVTLRAWELTGYVLQSNNLAADGGKPLEAVLRKLFARSIAFYEDYYFFQGNGVGQPTGIISAAGSATVTRQTSASFTVQDVGGMSAKLIPSVWSRAMWAMHPLDWAKVVALNTNAFQINQPVRMKPGVGPDFLINGQEGYVTEKLPTLSATSKGDVCLFDPGLYVLGDREDGLDIAVSKDEPTAWAKNQSVWRLVHRFDGQPMFGSTLTLMDGTTSVSPYVVLDHS